MKGQAVKIKTGKQLTIKGFALERDDRNDEKN